MTHDKTFICEELTKVMKKQPVKSQDSVKSKKSVPSTPFGQYPKINKAQTQELYFDTSDEDDFSCD